MATLQNKTEEQANVETGILDALAGFEIVENISGLKTRCLKPSTSDKLEILGFPT